MIISITYLKPLARIVGKYLWGFRVWRNADESFGIDFDRITTPSGDEAVVAIDVLAETAVDIQRDLLNRIFVSIINVNIPTSHSGIRYFNLANLYNRRGENDRAEAIQSRIRAAIQG